MIVAMKQHVPLKLMLMRIRLHAYNPELIQLYGKQLMQKCKHLNFQQRSAIFDELAQVRHWQIPCSILDQLCKVLQPEAVSVVDTVDSLKFCEKNENLYERGVRLSKSELWMQQKDFYLQQGLSAWSNNIVPFEISSNSFIADYYARICIEHMLYLWREKLLNDGRCVLLEFGAGHCKFGYLFAKRVQFYMQRLSFKILEIKPLIVLTDVNEKIIKQQCSSQQFSKLLDTGLIEFAVLDADHAHDCVELYLEHSQTKLMLHEYPVLGIANYFFDSLKADLFISTKNKVYEALISNKKNKRGSKILAKSVKLCNSHELQIGSDDTYSYFPTDDPLLDFTFQQIITSHQALHESSLVYFPTQAIRLLATMMQCKHFSMLLGDVPVDSHRSSNSSYSVSVLFIVTIHAKIIDLGRTVDSPFRLFLYSSSV